MKPLPLTGVRVLDLSRVLAGPLCSMTLGDLGAEVIKVERPEGGDDTRGWGPPFDADGRAAYFLSVNRNKLSLAIDFRAPADIALLLALLREADVVLENFLPGVLARYGIDRDAELARNEGLVWCTISGFGAESRRPGYDFVVQAESGWMAITGPEEGAPYKMGVALADVIAGKDATAAILAALVGRERKRLSERALHVSLAASATASLVNVAQNALVTGAEARRWGNAHPNLVPYQLFEAADRAMVIAVGSDAQWAALVHALALRELAEDPALATNAGRLASRERVVSQIAQCVRSREAAHWMAKLEGAGVPCGVVRTVREALSDVRTNPVTGVAPAFGGVVRHEPPRLGEHSSQIRQKHWSVFDHVPTLPLDDV